MSSKTYYICDRCGDITHKTYTARISSYKWLVFRRALMIGPFNLGEKKMDRDVDMCEPCAKHMAAAWFSVESEATNE